MSTERRLSHLLVAACALLIGACGGSQSAQVQCHPSDTTRCAMTGGVPEAAGMAVAAGVLWATAGGCGTNGCNPPYRCNAGTGFCERTACGEGLSCPPPFECDYQERACY